MDSNVRWLFFLLVLLTPVCTAGEAASVAASSLLTSTTFNTTATINTWTSLGSAIKAAAGKSTALTLSASCSGYTAAINISTAYTNVTIIGNGATFDANEHGRFFEVGEKALLAMSNVTLLNGHIQVRGLSLGGAVYVAAGGTFTVTSTTFSGNVAAYGMDGENGNGGGAVCVAAGGSFTATNTTFSGNNAYDYAHGGAVYVAANGTFTATSTTFFGNYVWAESNGGAVYVASGGTFTVTSSTFSGNYLWLYGDDQGGAVYVASGGTFTVTSSTFSGNYAGAGHGYDAGGALYFDGGTGLIKNCTFVGPISDMHNDIYNKGGNVTFACADDEVGTPVQMQQSTEITVIPPKELKCTIGNCFCRDSKCVVDPTATLPCTKCETPGACV
jgi:hypothetical protein